MKVSIVKVKLRRNKKCCSKSISFFTASKCPIYEAIEVVIRTSNTGKLLHMLMCVVTQNANFVNMFNLGETAISAI